MTDLRVDIVICRTPLEIIPPVFSGQEGAVLDFWGVIRGLEGEAAIAGIDYEAHEAMARHQLDLVAREAAGSYPIRGVLLHHRIGFVPVAEPSLFLRVSAGHRGPAFEAARWIIEELKRRVPIWKHPLEGETGTEIPAAGALPPDN